MMELPTPVRRLVYAGAFFVASTAAINAATLRVPEDFDRIQRAIFVAAPGDIITIAAGTYSENLFLNSTVMLRGAGVDKTIIRSPNRQEPILTVETGGTVTISDLTLSHAPKPEGKEPDTANFSVIFSYAPVILRNARIENPSGYALKSEFNLLTMENVTFPSSHGLPIHLEETLPSTQVTGLTIAPPNWGSLIEVRSGAAVFKNLDLGVLPERAKIVVSGAASNVRFVDLSPELREKIEWANSSPDGPMPEKIEDFEKSRFQEHAQTGKLYADYREKLRAKEPPRRQLLRDLQRSLRASKNADDTLASLTAFLPKLYATALVLENWGDDKTIDLIVSTELRALHERYGSAALVRALELPGRAPETQLKTAAYTVIGFDLQEAIAVHEAEVWVKANIPDLPELLSTWRKAPKTNFAARDAFLTSLKSLSAKSLGSEVPNEARPVLRKLVIAEIPAFTAQNGTSALDELLRTVAKNPTDILTLDQLRAALTPEQKIALIQHWKKL